MCQKLTQMLISFLSGFHSESPPPSFTFLKQLTMTFRSCKFLSEESRASEREKFRTECWLEQCIFEERICEKDENPAYQPLRSDQTIEGKGMQYVLQITPLSPLRCRQACTSHIWCDSLGKNVSGKTDQSHRYFCCHLLLSDVELRLMQVPN